MIPFVPLALWLGAVNLAAWLAFRHDKRQAVAGGRRLPEATLLALAALGGWPASKLAQRRFRHKTRKQPFATHLNFAIAASPAAILAVTVLRNLPLPDAALLRDMPAAPAVAPPGPAHPDASPTGPTLPPRFRSSTPPPGP